MVKEWNEKGIPVFGKITTEQISETSRWIAGRLD